MKEYTFSKEQLDKMAKEYAFDECESCGGIREVSFEHIKLIVDCKSMEFTSIPMLKCKSCGELAFTFYSKKIIYGCYNELKEMIQE